VFSSILAFSTLEDTELVCYASFFSFWGSNLATTLTVKNESPENNSFKKFTQILQK